MSRQWLYVHDVTALSSPKCRDDSCVLDATALSSPKCRIDSTDYDDGAVFSECRIDTGLIIMQRYDAT
jgi:hypothetical protein